MLVALRPVQRAPVTQPADVVEDGVRPDTSALESLPKTYADMLRKIEGEHTQPERKRIPVLGPAVPGDIGHAWAIQQGLGQAQGSQATLAAAYGSSASIGTAQQQRLEQLRTLEQARASPLFFAGKANPAAKPEPVSDNDMIALLTRLGSPSATTPASVPNPAASAGGEADTTNPRENASYVTASARPGAVTPRDAMSNAHSLTPLVSPYTLMAGSLIPAALLGYFNSDLPGMVQAQVTQNVYDSVSGQHLLIPQGARLIGRHDARVLFGQERALLVWTRLILPDGSSLTLDSFDGADARGQAGLSGDVDVHGGRLIKGILLSSLLGVGSELSLGAHDSGSLRALTRAIQDSGNTAGQEIIRRHLEVKPTLRITGGTRLNVLVGKDLILKPWRHLP